MNVKYPLRLTSLGLNFLYISIVAGILLSLLLILITFLGMYEVVIIFGIVSIGLGVLGLVGQLLCTNAPNDMSGKFYLYFSFLTAIFSVAFPSFSDVVLQFLPANVLQFAKLIGQMVSFLAYVASTIFFLMFLKHLAIYLRDDRIRIISISLIKSVPSLLLNFIGILVVSLILVVLKISLFALIIFVVGTLITLVLSISHFFSYLGLLDDLRHATRRFELPVETTA